MSFATQSRKQHVAGLSFLTQKEKNNRTPWYLSNAWQRLAQVRRMKVLRRVERAVSRRLEREDKANGIVRKSNLIFPWNKK